MSLYKIVVSKSAIKELSKLPAKENNRIIPAIKNLSVNPRPVGAKKLKGGSGAWRIRVGNYRVVYAIDDEVLIVDVRKVGHRKDIYD
ncbi:MAG: type II toxin-antitoxin system RelE/ParE family toxin [Bacteroidota bacterium]